LSVVMALVLALGCAVPAHAVLTAQTVATFPGVTDDMTKASYWSDKQSDPDAVLADRATIDALNQAGVDADGTGLQPLRTASGDYYTEQRKEALKNSAASELNGMLDNLEWEPVYKQDWTLIDKEYVDSVLDNYPAGDATPDIVSPYAIVTTHSVMRAYPTDKPFLYTKDDYDDNNLYVSALRVNEPVLIRAQSVDKEFYLCISSCLNAAWVPAKDLAICKDKAEWLGAWDIPEDKELVVTGYKVRTEQSRVTPETADRMLYMGTVLERVDLDSPQQALDLVGTRSAFYNHVCYLPVREDDGTYSKQLALIAASDDVSEGYLPLTKANIARVAFNSLGKMYGWGGMLEANDCSGYVRDVYKCFGLELARNTNWQMNLPVRNYDLTGFDDAHKAALIAQLPLGTVLFWGGHEMIYLGQEGDELYVISSLGGIGDPYDEAGGAHQVKSVAINSLDMVRANRATWLSTLTAANVPYIPASDQGTSPLDLAFYKSSVVWPTGSHAYTGQAIEPSVEIPGLTEGEDYKVVYSNNVEVGKATVAVEGAGAYNGSLPRGTFKITRANQAISAKSPVAKTIKAGKPVNLKKLAGVSAKTAVQYQKANTAGKSKIAINAKTGVVTTSKGLKPGAYKVKVKLTAPKDDSYKAASAKTIALNLTIV
ncbi:MAG: SH3 domain-containing protein, partial [Eggerthellaceae bacterium]|nr:SH3 domain-containing protein [Eggerthellaceae bacterium]